MNTEPTAFTKGIVLSLVKGISKNMAVSQKQLIANRRNAARSTGPKTEQGKAIASRNAITHGLATPDIVINSPNLTENAQHYDHLLQSLFDE
ncbi:MAG: hypothetical protein GY832_37815, partial [Chloroflexi bacterium]|nr:hypothetical protein [Chloroflexota bacterium]